MENDYRDTGILMDLDGVILDTENIYTQFWDEIDHAYPTHVSNFAHVIKGRNLHEILHTYFDSDDVRARVTAMLNAFQRDMRYNYFVRAVDVITWFRQRGCRIAVVTSSDDAKMAAVYRQHEDFKAMFDAIITGDMVHNAKPHPECYLLGAKAIGCDIERCYVFEDSINGLKAGRAAGAHVVGLATTVHREDIAPHAHEVYDSLEHYFNCVIKNK